ncbi:hypothetical protein B0J13DRAFT_648893 [Dactylonectria estremocensis]|uniref:Uncharacterized protein n=1 Tax=Dactylonectria estremocensis TaxID=1079267 RepID=A0A9P9DJQ6_9HYPO|nr:hypothetical protein B0J13DRAFT_648893 [Dactylonectria estremocensis]
MYEEVDAAAIYSDNLRGLLGVPSVNGAATRKMASKSGTMNTQECMPPPPYIDVNFPLLSRWLMKRAVNYQTGFLCDRGTCYQGDDGFVGLTVLYVPYCVTITNVVMKEYAMHCDVVSNLTDIKTISYAKSQLAATTTQDETESTTDANFQTATINDVATGNPDTSSVPRTTSDGSTRSGSFDDQDISTNNGGESSGAGHSKDGDAATSVSEDQGTTEISSPNSGSDHSSRNTIIGSVVGVISGVILALIGVWCFKSFRRKPAPPPQNVQPAPFLQLPQISPDMQSSLGSHFNYQSPVTMQHTSVSPTSLSLVGSSVTGAPTQAFGSLHELHGNGENSQTSSRNWYRHETMTTAG